MIWFVFAQAVSFDFTNFDDNRYVSENEIVSNGLTKEGICHFLTTSHCANWHPLTSLSYMLDYEFYGLNPAGYHLTNILLHIAAALALFLALRSLTGSLWRSAVVAAVFAIHPLRVESVAWISERKDVLSGLFFMLTLWGYSRYAKQPFSIFRYIFVLLLFTLGLLSKSMLVTLPGVLLLLDFWPLGRRDIRRILLEKIPLILISAAFCVVTILAQERALTQLDVPHLYRIANAIVSYVVYLKQMVWPVGLSIMYPHPGSNLSLMMAGLCLWLLLAVSGAAWLCRKKQPWLLTGWLWYLGMLLPVIGLVQVGVQSHADRYTYLPQIGISIMLVWGLAAVPILQKNKTLCWGLLLSILLALTLTARRQTTVWRNSMTLWTHALEHTKKNPTALVGLGSAFFKNGDAATAEVCFLEALQIDPYDKEAIYNVGFVRVNQGRLEEGIPFLRLAVRLSPDQFNTHKALGAALILQNQLHEGLLHSRRALELKPDDASIVRNIQIAEARLKKESQE